ncbi:hypothetical protein NCCP2716_17020 [Sporosarcina sp. NCCP-2716]|uniref:hypothetical protein n=1 Tax=Sporosarcina sp. NCCP-2716 TaxID=2943679 RepID=UPI00203B6C42|nr:hypothetical protein [Sporosarcina sp. NCCP-2716]GKV69204.1 hypothetical protein NCCP2716_17020 [Sporosarcina sp. NCCP-2716]
MVKIALFGSSETIQLITSFEAELDGIKLETFRYLAVEDLERLLPLAADCEVYLFSGILPYRHAECLLGQFDKPAVYMEDNELNVSLTLLHILSRNLCPLDRLSIDLPDRRYVDDIVRQLRLDPAPTHVKDFAWLHTTKCPQFETEPIQLFHKDLWNAGKTSLAVTSIHSVYDQLVEQGIPSLRFIDADNTVRDVLLRAKQAGVLQQTQLAQVAVCLIDVSGETVQQISADGMALVKEAMLTAARQVNGEIQQIGPLEFEYFGTKGSIQFLLDQSSLLNPVISAANNLSATLQAGAGYGRTITEAKKNAAIALSHSEPEQHSFIVVTEEKEVINPLAKQQIRTLSTTDSHIRYLANTAKVSIPNLVKMQQFLQARAASSFTSDDIADYFQLTKRSAERMLKKYMDAGWLHIVGEEHPHRNGRPRAVYQLEFPLTE